MIQIAQINAPTQHPPSANDLIRQLIRVMTMMVQAAASANPPAVSRKTVGTISARHGNLLESKACSTNSIALLFVKSEHVSEIPQIKIITQSVSFGILIPVTVNQSPKCLIVPVKINQEK